MSRLILGQELKHLREGELLALFNAVSLELHRSNPETPERRNAFASLENIQRELNHRRAKAWAGAVAPKGALLLSSRICGKACFPGAVRLLHNQRRRAARQEAERTPCFFNAVDVKKFSKNYVRMRHCPSNLGLNKQTARYLLFGPEGLGCDFVRFAKSSSSGVISGACSITLI
ncbi:MAG: hypothetical protein GY764_08185 [Halieaceae bacterium]|nr:hypothetical protein [Halieaceae bacterium]